MKEHHLKVDTKESEQITKEKEYQPQMHVRDANSHLIFSNPLLTCQFLKGYTGIPLFQNLTPEDIEDVSERYEAFLGVEFETDTVKRIKVKVDGQEKEIYVISLIEHKSYVDYDIAMQLLRYMTVIWHDYKVRRNKEKEGVSSQKQFRYPLILPVVYYEGEENWTADMHLLDRIECGELLREFLPDFQYKVVRLHDYTNDDLQEKHDEMSLVMMINKIQSEKDYQEFLKIAKKVIDTIYQNTSEDIKEIYRIIIWSLLMKMKVPQEQAQRMIEGLGVKGMGYLFENMKEIDIGKMQEESRKVKCKLEETKEQLEEAKGQLSETQGQLSEAQGQLSETQGQLRDAERKLLSLAEKYVIKMCEQGKTKEKTIREVIENYGLSDKAAIDIVERCWK